MKLAHLADTHLGFRRYERRSPAGANQREADAAQAFQRAVDGVLAARPDLVVVAGDVFDKLRPTNLSLAFAGQQFQRLTAAGLPTVCIAGNHETPHEDGIGSPLALLRLVGVQVVVDRFAWLDFPALGCRVLAVPEATLEGPAPPPLAPAGEARYHVLLAHGNCPATLAPRSPAIAPLHPDALAGWSYVALGHWHLQQQMGPRCWYAGSLEYLSADPWREGREEARLGIPGKGWLLADLEAGTVTRQPVALARQTIDLPPLDAAGWTVEELDAALQANLPPVVAGQILRQVVTNVPTEFKRTMNHRAIATVRASALVYQLDLRRPEPTTEVLGVRVATRGKGIEAILAEALTRRALPPGMDRSAFVAAGAAAMRDPEETARESAA